MEDLVYNYETNAVRLLVSCTRSKVIYLSNRVVTADLRGDISTTIIESLTVFDLQVKGIEHFKEPGKPTLMVIKISIV